ncbi:MAG: SPFH domain-containing protein [Candidatus Ornithospirochaeta sp.]
MAAVIILILLLVLVIFIVIKGFVIISQGETMVIERLGKYSRTLNSGVNILIPFIEKPRDILWRTSAMIQGENKITPTKRVSKIDLREQVYDYPKQNVITKDNVNIEIDALLYFQITDPVRAVYEVADLPNAIEKLTQTTLRNVIGELELDESLSSRDTINGKLTKILDEATDKWGVKVNRVELKDITPPKEIRETMEKQMRAERDRRAAILLAEGDKQSKILEAEGFRESEVNKAKGNKDAAILIAEGEAEAKVRRANAEAESIRIVTEAFGNPEEARNYLVAMRYIDTLGAMVEGKDNKVVYMPYEATGVLSSIGSVKDLFQKTN